MHNTHTPLMSLVWTIEGVEEALELEESSFRQAVDHCVVNTSYKMIMSIAFCLFIYYNLYYKLSVRDSLPVMWIEYVAQLLIFYAYIEASPKVECWNYSLSIS